MRCVSTENLSKQFLDSVPLAMREIRTEMRSIASDEMSVPQFRIMAHLARYERSTNSELAEILGSTPPSMCRLVSCLRAKGYIRVLRSDEDRRLVDLELSPSGRKVFLSYQREASKRFSSRFEILTSLEKKEMARGLEILARVFEREPA